MKYVRFRDLKQLENDKLIELIDMIEHSLTSTVPAADDKKASVSISKGNKSTLHTNNIILPVHHDEPTVVKAINSLRR